ncbi:Rho GTPase-activating protein 21-A, partial [Stegodyphus mimosarum]
MDSSNIHGSCRRYTNDIDDKFRPRTVTLVKDKNGFGFTLRHFIVYPPTRFNSAKGAQDNSEDPSLSFAQWNSDYKNKPMDTIFIREVKEGSPAHNAGLNKGDRIIAINNHPLTGKSYADIIHLILKSGQRLRLLVVPKEDDILQLYFASSAYQPVHREGKQHKYLVPSFPSDTGQSNHLYRQSSYSTYPGRVLNKVKASANKTAESPKQSSQCMYLGPSFAHSTNEDSNLPSTLQVVQDLERKGYDLPLPEKELYEGGCFSEDEGLYHHKELRNNELCNLQPPKLKDTVANFYYSLCHDQPTSVLSFSSEENLNYPIYMSDFDDIVHCDNMEDSRNNPDSLHGTDGAILPNPNRYPYQCDRPRYSSGNPTCDRISDSSCLCVSDLQTPSYWTSNKMSTTKDISQEFSTDHSFNHSATMCHHSGESNSLPCDFNFTDNQETPSINLVAQRRHQFESGNLLAESMERMKLYRSELSRMSKPNQVRIVSSRAAEFENKSQMSVVSPTRNHKQEDCVDKLNEATLHEEKCAQNEQSNKYVYDLSLDHQNRNKMQPEDSVHESDPNIYANVTAEDILTPSGPGVVHRRKTVPVSSDQDECHIVRRISYLRATANERMNVESDLSEEDETSDASSPNKEYRIQKLKSFFGEKTPKVKQALVPVEANDTDVSCNHEPQEEQQKSVYGWVICKVVSLEGKRSSDRSWRHLWAILRNNILYLLKERR